MDSQPSSEMKYTCETCFRHCRLAEGQSGFCGARACRDGKVVCTAYGRATSLALDPIEKKPLRRFHPGSLVVSVGSFGCNLACPFCQNYEISRKTEGSGTRYISPEELLEITLRTRQKYPRTIGVAFTYNEPLTSWEYVRDAAKLIHEAGLCNVLVTSGTAEPGILDELLPYIDAMNIDLKGFTEEYYRDYIHGSLQQTMNFIQHAVQSGRSNAIKTGQASDQHCSDQHCHVELTTLIIPGRNDGDETMRQETAWIASLDRDDADVKAAGQSKNLTAGTTIEITDRKNTDTAGTIPLHISRYFPRYHENQPPTPISMIYHLADVAREQLRYVYTGNC